MKGLKLGKRGTKRAGYVVTFSIGVQGFTLDIGGREKDEERIKFYHRMLRKAFKTFLEANEDYKVGKKLRENLTLDWSIEGYKGKRAIKPIYKTYTKTGKVRKPKKL